MVCFKFEVHLTILTLYSMKILIENSFNQGECTLIALILVQELVILLNSYARSFPKDICKVASGSGT